MYDEGNVLDNDEASANNFAKLFTYHDARNPVRILDGGFIHFSKKYSFLRSAEMAHTPRQLAAMITVSVMHLVFCMLPLITTDLKADANGDRQ